MWRCVLDGGMPLSEVNQWDIEDVFKFNALLTMRDNHRVAFDEFTRPKEQTK